MLNLTPLSALEDSGEGQEGQLVKKKKQKIKSKSAI